MKDYLHLFGGMGAAILALAIYIFAFSACAEERITYPASDLIKVQEVQGILPIYEPPREKVTVYRLELHSDTNGNETAYVVGADGVERPVVLVDPMEYKLLTERLDAVWQSFHATADGRRKLHGKIERTEIDENALKKVVVYADGYRHTEAMPKKRVKPAAATLMLPAAKIEKQKPGGMSDRQWKMRKAFEKYRMGVPKTVTVEHDAATGKDTVLEGK